MEHRVHAAAGEGPGAALTIDAPTDPDTDIELYGRSLCGLAPNTPYF
jgi:hypothetical protein